MDISEQVLIVSTLCTNTKRRSRSYKKTKERKKSLEVVRNEIDVKN
jgi:hypothetical protein